MREFIELPRRSDAHGLYLYFSGGIRAASIGPNAWRIEPILANGKPCATGPLSMHEMQQIAKANGLKAVAFHSFSWMDGDYTYSWNPIIPGQVNHSESPSQLWSNIASNITRPRTAKILQRFDRPTEDDIARVFDDQHPVEAMARYISLSLRSLDISVEQIAAHYNEQLVSKMSAGHLNGERSNNTSAQSLYAHLHSFFLHLGAARDYLGRLIAHRIGFDTRKIDSMTRLIGAIKQSNLPRDAVLDLLFSSGNISTHSQKTGRFIASGWIEDVTVARNRFVHHEPYGSKSKERFGYITPAHGNSGFFRYFRPLEVLGESEHDVFDFIHHHYVQCAKLFNDAARASGNNTAMIHITDEDAISIEIRTPNDTPK